ncbi:MAG: ribosome maturation factor [Acidobacteria bacterium]|nr:ribosome maturation factor [Acidobacteriota bacterium]
MSTEKQRAANEGIAGQVRPIAERVAARIGCEVVSVRYLSDGGSWVLRIVIDTDGGVNVDQCAKLSRQLSAILDVEDFIEAAYNLEVSSPGLDRELLVAVDFERYSGQRIRIQTVPGPEGSTVLRGKLRGIEAGNVLLDLEDGERIELPRSSVSEARLEIEI